MILRLRLKRICFTESIEGNGGSLRFLNYLTMKKRLVSVSVFAVLAIFLMSSGKVNYRLYVGGYTDKEGDKGFSTFSFDPEKGTLKPVSQVDAGPNPSYFCFSPEQRVFYVIDEVMEFRGAPGGGLTTIKETGDNLEKLSEMSIPFGGPCFVSISHDSSHLLVANYPAGSVAVAGLDKAGVPRTITDTILYDRANPESSHAHMILSDPAGGKLYVSDLGLNTVASYDFDSSTGRLMKPSAAVTRVAEGSGPRHFTFNADGSKFYLINELGSTIMVFNVKGNGGLDLLQTVSTLKPEYKGENACADIHFGKDGKFLYGSNRGENTIVTFSVGSDGLLTYGGTSSCGGDWPRNFTIDPSGRFMLVGNERSDNIAVFRINEKTGLPSTLASSTVSRKPVCLKIYKTN
jgi:6-phosphogluconolactonase